MKRSVSQDDLARLKEAREEADRRYNEALTALDAALPSPRADYPRPAGPPDEHQFTPLNEQWHILATGPDMPAGWRGRLAGFVWRLVEPVFARQQTFNAALIDHLNRNRAGDRERAMAVDAIVQLARQQLDAVAVFHSRLIVYLQQLTPYVDTKDYEFAGLARRINEDAHEAAEQAEKAARGVAGALSGLSDELLRRFESLVARDQRYDAALRELKTTMAAVQQLTQSLRRQVEDLHEAAPAAQPAGAPARRKRAAAQAAAGAPSGGADQLLASDRIQSHQYVGFEDLYRGSEVDIQGRMSDYVERFRGASDVLDVGCGRGEFLELLREAGIAARGVDLNHEMVERCRARGLDVTEADALGYLRGLPAQSLGGLLAAQVVEHLAPDYLLRFLSAAFDALHPGSTLILETINPASWAAFFDSYIRDLTHQRPVHPDTLRYLVTASGFADAAVEFRSPYAPENKLHRVPDAVRAEIADTPAVVRLADAVDRNVDRLNELLFTYMDYAVIARRP